MVCSTNGRGVFGADLIAKQQLEQKNRIAMIVLDSILLALAIATEKFSVSVIQSLTPK